MQRTLSGLIVAALVLAAVPAMAGKVGWVEVTRAAVTVKEGQQVLKQLEEWAKPREARVKSLAKAADEAKQQAARQRGVASEDAQERLEQAAVKAQRDYEDAARTFQRDYNDKHNQLLKPIADRLKAVIADYSKSNGYDAVFVLEQTTLVYLADSSNLTDTIIKLYDERFPVSAD